MGAILRKEHLKQRGLTESTLVLSHYDNANNIKRHLK